MYPYLSRNGAGLISKANSKSVIHDNVLKSEI